MELKPGMRLRSVTCSTETIVVRAPAGDVDLRCGGAAMSAMSAAGAAATGVAIDAAHANGTLMGKRYADDTLELLCTKPGAGSLSLGDVALEVKGAKALPSSD